jgi:hypothetical protein
VIDALYSTFLMAASIAMVITGIGLGFSLWAVIWSLCSLASAYIDRITDRLNP